MTLKFGDITTKEGAKAIDEYLGDRSYIDGYIPSGTDLAVLNVLKSEPSKEFAHFRRWYKHVKSYGGDTKVFSGASKDIKSLYGITNSAATKTPQKADDDDDDVDLFGSEEEDEESVKQREARLKAYEEKKSKKPTIIAKSSVVLDVKPWDDETNMKEMENFVRAISTDGLTWGASKLVPVGYGISKLQIMCTVVDEKVSIEWLSEEIQNNEDLVQSVDIAAFNKI